jgi:hypothetical protein
MALKGQSPSQLGTCLDFFPVTPNDGVDILVEPRWISVAVAGNLAVTKRDGTSVTLALPAGIFPAGGVQRVLATGTTATGLVAWV